MVPAASCGEYWIKIDLGRKLEKDDVQQLRKPYTKPELRRIQLRPEEAVLGACKTSGTSGPGGMGNCAPVGPCMSDGS